MPQKVRRVKYRKKAGQYVVAVRIDLDIDRLVYRKWGGEQSAKSGDWLVENRGDVYTVDAKVFAKTYKKLHPGIYVKTTPVWAEVAAQAGSIGTYEGATRYKRGDYLISSAARGPVSYAVSKAKFKAMYRREQ
jgi:hypothetical protein